MYCLHSANEYVDSLIGLSLLYAVCIRMKRAKMIDAIVSIISSLFDRVFENDDGEKNSK
jgi:hypothetical protein